MFVGYGETAVGSVIWAAIVAPGCGKLDNPLSEEQVENRQTDLAVSNIITA